MDHAKAEYIDAQAALKIEIESSLAKCLAAAKDGSNADENAILRDALTFWRGRLSTLEDAWSARNIVAAPPTQGKSQLSAHASSPLRLRTYTSRSLFVLSRAPCVPPSALCTFKSALCVGLCVVVCARNRLRGWESEIAGLARELPLWPACGLACCLSLNVSNHLPPPPSASLPPPCPLPSRRRPR